jgi:hypothetical protein
MKVTEPEQAQRFAVLYKATIDHAVAGAPDLMARLVAHARATLRDLEARASDRRERERLTLSRRQLNQCESDALARFTDELKTAFVRMEAREPASVPSAAQPHFDEIAGMDAAQVQRSVDSARVRHAVQIAADQALAELSQLMCTMLGLAQVQLERNPLRPAVYVDALATALGQLPVAPVVRQGWLSMMSGALGQELDIYYRQLCADLHQRGVASDGAAGATPAHADTPASPDTHALTLERLRRLLVHGPDEVHADIAQQFHPEFEDTVDMASASASDAAGTAAPSAFRPTVPAALDAVQDMPKVARVVRRIETARADAEVGLRPPGREALRRAAHGLDQSLALEVVALMVDNICHDGRLLGPVQDLVARLEPALLRLALVDPRFFSHKQHPARRLLHEITHRSIAFESVDSRGFSGFMEPLQDAVSPLTDGAIDGAEPFDQALARLVAVWDEPASRERRQIARAVNALQQAEQRTALAAIMVREVLARPDAALVPSSVLDFLCGPWAQVVAQARITDRSGVDDPGGYAGLIDELMWSAQPALTSQDVPALRRMLPRLQQVLQQGLATIECPEPQTQEVFAALAQLHQRGLDQRGLDQQAFADTENQGQSTAHVPAHSRWDASDSAWLVPSEARVSGFIDMPLDAVTVPDAALSGQLVVGAWVALKAEGSWSRTRLAWTSANGSLLLFVDALGFIQSLSRRACEQLHAQDHLRIISTDPVEDALDAVARTALRNSVDIRF